MASLKAVILAAGQGTRMKSSLPKVLHPLAGQPIVQYAVETATRVTGTTPVLVIGHGGAEVQAAIGDRARYATQSEQLGTGHAVAQARDLLAAEGGTILVTYADMPLLTVDTLRSLAATHARTGATLSLLTVSPDEPRGFGRVVRDARGQVLAVVEEADCTPEQRTIRELNAGIYCFEAVWLWENLSRLPLSAKGEYYLTDMVAMAVSQGQPVTALECLDEGELMGINTRVHLAEAEAIIRTQINHAWMEAGVTLPDPASTYIDSQVQIGPDTTIMPGTYLQGQTVIGSNCRIGPNTLIQNCEIGDRCVVLMSVLEDAVMEDGANIGPFGHLRKGSRVCRDAHMGNFGEMKNSTLGQGSKMGHFSYLGDAQVGANVNIGAGTITCNFDGVHKNSTIIEDDVFIGSDSMLVAPLRIERGAKTGAGSVVTHDVPAGSVAYGVPARVKRKPDAAAEQADPKSGAAEER